MSAYGNQTHQTRRKDRSENRREGSRQETGGDEEGRRQGPVARRRRVLRTEPPLHERCETAELGFSFRRSRRVQMEFPWRV